MSLSLVSLRRLNYALLHRNIPEGFALLEQMDKDFARLGTTDALASAYLLCLAQWVDMGYRSLALLDGPMKRVLKVQRSEMRVSEYVNLALVEAFSAFASEDAPRAISTLDSVLRMDPSVVDRSLVALAHYWKARAHRTQGEYELALQHIVVAKTIATQLKAPKMVGEMKIHESWVLFQRGQRKDAFRLLDEAESGLQQTGHVLALGNIESARGRFVRRSGEYVKALAHFSNAVAIYSERFPAHPNTARALVNAAYVKRLIALDLKHRLNAGRAKAVQHAQYLAICQDALDLLGRASEIYDAHHHQAGMGSVYVNAGYLHLDSGDIDRAESEAAKAFTLGEQRDDHILMARARTLQSALQNERAEEQTEESPDASLHAVLAKTYAEEAVAIAKLTQNKRLLAGAYIAQSTAAASELFQDWETAKEFAALASGLLAKDDRDHLDRELRRIKARILRAAGIDETLRLWSEGIISHKTFQQVTEEFAEIVIPKVWLREGRKISKVAETLSMSPKKVRRILAKVSLAGKS